MKYILEIKPAINPQIRHEIQDLLTAKGFEVHGGGTHTDMSSCDVTFSGETSNKPFKEV